MVVLKPGCFQAVADDTREAVLAGWLRTATEAYMEAALMLGVNAEGERLREALQGHVSVDILRPSYQTLAQRYRDEIDDGTQPDLFCDSHQGRLRERWVRFALGYLRQEGRAPLRRWVLQATVGLENGVNRSTAANLLVGNILDSPL